ncbi:MAG: matrixin family metalloprotease [Candidatus Pacearchaeota archaeon]
MKKIILFGVLSMILSLGFVLAEKPNFTNAGVVPSNNYASVKIPENAVEVSPGVFYVGSVVDNGDIIEGYAFIHYKDKKGNAKPPWAGGGDATTSCYTFLASGARWKVTEPYYINPTNLQGLSEDFIVSSALEGDNEWDKQVTFDIFGNPMINYLASYNNGNLDGVNTLSFGSIADPGVIGVTTVWGIFSGNPKNRKLVEWDMLLDQHDFQWGDATLNASKMDLQNIITHELGHSAGMGDLYSGSCSEETMYGYATEGEIKKRNLNYGDIAGIKKLYS